MTTNDDVIKMKSDLNIKEVHCNLKIYNSIQSTTQCTKCQKFDHLYVTCKNKNKCNICAQNHETQ